MFSRYSETLSFLVSMELIEEELKMFSIFICGATGIFLLANFSTFINENFIFCLFSACESYVSSCELISYISLNSKGTLKLRDFLLSLLNTCRYLKNIIYKSQIISFHYFL